MQPIAGWSKGHNLAGGRASAAKTGTNQLGDTGDNRDAWMVGYTPSLSTAVWVGTSEGVKPLKNSVGRAGLRIRPTVGHLEGHHGRCAGRHRQGDFPQADGDRRLRGCAAGPAAPPPGTLPTGPQVSVMPSETVIQPTIEVAPVSRSRSALRRPCRSDRRRELPLCPARRAFRCRRRLRDGRSRGRPPAGLVSPAPPAGLVSPAPPAGLSVAGSAGRRPAGADDRDLPSRNDQLAEALSQTVGGPVGRHALIGRSRFMTPLRVMFIIAVVFLAWGTRPKPPVCRPRARAPRANAWPTGRTTGPITNCVTPDTVPLYTAELLNLGKFPYKSSAGSRTTRPASPACSTTAARRSATWSTGAHRALPVRVDVAGQDTTRR